MILLFFGGAMQNMTKIEATKYLQDHFFENFEFARN